MSADQLLQAVLKNSQDDEPRFAYADWLSSQNDPRGEFIRAQVPLDRFRGGQGGAISQHAFLECQATEEKLLAKHERE